MNDPTVDLVWWVLEYLTPKELAEMENVSVSTVSLWKNGHRGMSYNRGKRMENRIYTKTNTLYRGRGPND